MNIAVLAGGRSTEREVSIKSGKMVDAALRKKGHSTLLLDLFYGYTKELEDINRLFSTGQMCEKYTIGEDIPVLDTMRRTGGCGITGENVMKICKAADIVFMALHGEEGENGKLQAAFDVFGIKYTGCGSLGSALAMDKGLSKGLFSVNGIPAPPGIVLKKGDPIHWDTFPCVVKPCSGGSSVGVSIVHSKEAFSQALANTFRFEETAIVEEYINGREFSVGVLAEKVLPVIEICPKSGFYDYKNKYQSGMTEAYCPADLPTHLAEKMQDLAFQVFQALKLEVYARIDFCMNPEGKLYCLEANTLPGMTNLSLFPQEANAVGISYEDLCEKILYESLKKYGGNTYDNC